MKEILKSLKTTVQNMLGLAKQENGTIDVIILTRSLIAISKWALDYAEKLIEKEKMSEEEKKTLVYFKQEEIDRKLEDLQKKI